MTFEVIEALHVLYVDDEPHPFGLTDHWRGTGAHLDHRWVRKGKRGILDGMTVAHMKPKATKEDVKTLDQARALQKQDVWKISDDPGALRMFATPKKPEPYSWLGYEGVIQPREVAGPQPGATRYEWGVFLTRDEGVQYYGAQEPYFKEFFLYGKKYTGRWIYRMIERQKPAEHAAVFLYLFGKPIDQMPYVLSRRAEKKNWIPPFGVSCLPPEIRKVIPESLQYWKQKNESKRLELRSELRKAISRDEVKIKLEEKVPYVVQHHWFKKAGKPVIRVGPSQEHWDLRIELSKTKPLIHFVLVDNPLDYSAPIVAFEKPCTDHTSMKKEGYIPPSTPEWNPTIDTPAYVDIIDKGLVDVLEDAEMFKKFDFHGRLKGLFILKREQPKARTWSFERSEVPK